MAKRVRKPFVMTIAALAVGCGGKFEFGPTSDADVSDSGPDTGMFSETGSADGGKDCPISAPPTAGARCTNEGATCYYGRCSPPLYQSDIQMRCEAGSWKSGGVASCNPPPPIEPCPAIEPHVGTSCARPMYASACKYADTCPFNPTDYGSNDYTCNAGTWRRTSPDYTASCPTTAPTEGSACACAGHMRTTSCNYGDCGGFATINASCNEATRKWSVLVTSCNPPPPAFDAGFSDATPP